MDIGRVGGGPGGLRSDRRHGSTGRAAGCHAEAMADLVDQGVLPDSGRHVLPHYAIGDDHGVAPLIAVGPAVDKAQIKRQLQAAAGGSEEGSRESSVVEDEKDPSAATMSEVVIGKNHQIVTIDGDCRDGSIGISESAADDRNEPAVGRVIDIVHAIPQVGARRQGQLVAVGHALKQTARLADRARDGQGLVAAADDVSGETEDEAKPPVGSQLEDGWVIERRLDDQMIVDVNLYRLMDRDLASPRGLAQQLNVELLSGIPHRLFKIRGGVGGHPGHVHDLIVEPAPTLDGDRRAYFVAAIERTQGIDVATGRRQFDRLQQSAFCDAAVLGGGDDQPVIAVARALVGGVGGISRIGHRANAERREGRAAHAIADAHWADAGEGGDPISDMNLFARQVDPLLFSHGVVSLIHRGFGVVEFDLLQLVVLLGRIIKDEPRWRGRLDQRKWRSVRAAALVVQQQIVRSICTSRDGRM